MFDRIAEITELAADEPAQDGGSLKPRNLPRLYVSDWMKELLIAIVADVTIISELEAGIGGIVLVVACKGF